MEKIYQLIAEQLNKVGVETQIANSDDDLTLRIMPEDMGPDNDGVVITEVCRVPVEDEDYGYFQIYTPPLQRTSAGRYIRGH